ncbi:type II toxin-antitoxin system PemK/MazF family toxin (plasmid) [Aneurinibacillus sp. Ricciae_BoGa-3]|uniref:type II toxin-antitoxin system PemK/MazF family toxin n=1 Tax=Aneurinibacillus sp. Ricciae_BoGa-3 TaxID=3022697 RepID=UPI0023416533|nr:type II toxin-antitoxin system PemK/MazF family toxin [Aneurinibacillus sp. Ricciae_BoGa-3]WCK56951.1 type II toxin-antitoxin system PemK/MazF family toxin [Aneurinibacillus sp. Ricciae_BoGa-3]
MNAVIQQEAIKREEIKVVRRGEIYFANIGSEGVGSEQNGVRPVLILQNDIGNKYSPTTIVCLITSMNKKLDLPVHLVIEKEVSCLPQDSLILLEQIRTIDKKRLIRRVSRLPHQRVEDINEKLRVSLGLNNQAK